MITYKTSQKVEIDIHNMTRDAAKRYIESFLNRVNGNVREVYIIHGYSSGTVLKDMVTKSLRHKKINGKVASTNPGITILMLN